MSKRPTKTSASAVRKPVQKKPVGFGAAPSVPKYRSSTATGEDLPALKRIAKELKGQNITVEDYILLVGPHTGDKGAALTQVMNEDLSAFRRMVIKVYDTMTKDASDVMANTQIELGGLYAEKQRFLVDNMLRSFQTIKNFVPEFDFQLYFKDPDKYLSSIFKLADIPDEEEIEIARRQLAYHRLQWLQSEGERLQAENIKLEERLTELKKTKRKQIQESLDKEREAENKRIELEQKQEEMQNELEELCDELHETIITEEKKTMDAQKEMKVKILAKRPAVEGKGDKEKEKDDWNVTIATEYSTAQVQGEASVNLAESVVSTLSLKAMKSKMQKPRSARTAIRGSPSETGSTSETALPLRKPGLKKKKKIRERPAWQDLEPAEFDTGSVEGAEEAPVVVEEPVCPPKSKKVPFCPLTLGKVPVVESSPSPTPPSPLGASPPSPMGSPSPQKWPPWHVPRKPPPWARAPQTQAQPQSPPTGRRARGPQDTWRGFR